MKIEEVLTGDAYIAKYWPLKAYLDQGKIPNKMILKGLAAEAKKAGSFQNFEQDYIGQIKHGLYWHWTNEANFRIDLNKGPRDMSSMGDGQMDAGRLMITSHLENWANYGPNGKSRPYVAVIDMSDVPRQAYYQVRRSFGNEFNVSDPSRARVIKVVAPQQAFRIDREQHKWLPHSSEQLLQFYQLATGLREGAADAADPRAVRPSNTDNRMPVPSNVTTPVLAAQSGPVPPTPTSPVSSTAAGGPVTSADMRGVSVKPGLPTAMGRTAGAAPPAGIQKDTSIPDLPPRRTR